MGSTGLPSTTLHETVWLDANRFYDAEQRYYDVSLSDMARKKNPGSPTASGVSQSSLASEIAFARQKIQNFLKSGDSGIDSSSSILSRLEKVEKENHALKENIDRLISEMQGVMSELSLVKDSMLIANLHAKDSNQVKQDPVQKINVPNGTSAPDDDDLDLFGSDEENEEESKLKEERVKAYAAKKSKKPALVAKSSVVLDVKPWDDETDMKAMETSVRAISTDGLVWGASKLVPLAYGIKKLQIVAIVEDDKVSVDWLQETICEIEELVQSVDIAAFNKL